MWYIILNSMNGIPAMPLEVLALNMWWINAFITKWGIMNTKLTVGISC